MVCRWVLVHVRCVQSIGNGKGIDLDHGLYGLFPGVGNRINMLPGWLSPELYLRRPPAKNEQYRVDRMLQAAAQRGVRVNIIVYKVWLFVPLSHRTRLTFAPGGYSSPHA
jgi:hypothetical protein